MRTTFPAPRRARAALLLALIALLAAGAAHAPLAHAGPRSASSAVVTMGDSYISGEAGRWFGNSIDPAAAATGPTAHAYSLPAVYVI